MDNKKKNLYVGEKPKTAWLLEQKLELTST